MKRNCKIFLGDIFLLAIICTFSLTLVVSAQRKQKRTTSKKLTKSSQCKIQETRFKCPKDFIQIQIIDKETTLYESKDKDSLLYFFVAMPKEKFDGEKLRKSIGTHLNGKKSGMFEWKLAKNPIFTSMNTKYEVGAENWLGYNEKLLSFVSRSFRFRDRQLVLGYVYDLQSDGDVELFEDGVGNGDSAAGCNVIATTLNSITREFRDTDQYCYITALSTSKF